MDKLLKNIPERQIYIIVIAIFTLTVLASYLYLFKKPYKAFSSLRTDRNFLQSKVSTIGNLGDEIAQLQVQVELLNKSLHGKSSYIPANKILAHNIEILDRVSKVHEINLESVKPATPNTLELFQEVPLSIRVTGPYVNLYKWLHDVEDELGPMVVKQFEIMPGINAKELLMNLKMVSYLPISTL